MTSAGTESVEARRGAYADSVTLLQISSQIGALPGVHAAMIAMATELNLELAAGMGFTAPEATGPNDMLIAVRTVDGETMSAAMAAVDAALARRPGSASTTTTDRPARTIASALRQAPGGLVLISVPGRYALPEAMDAIDAGADVMIFSDNVPVAHEIALKDAAARRGVLVMGPDCGTAVIGGIGLGFANATQPGPVGIVAASGTGAQQLLCLLDTAGIGISACLGVGGRDLSAAVGGRSTLAALDILDRDPATEVIVVVSKPPAGEVAAAVQTHAAQLNTPVIFGLLGAGQPDLAELARDVVSAAGGEIGSWPRWSRQSGKTAGDVPAGATGPSLRGLFAGGTLCDEAMLIASSALGEIRSNIPLRPEWAVNADLRSAGHVMIDFGDDTLTAGRPHPMIDSTMRLERLRVEATDRTCGVVLLDVGPGPWSGPGSRRTTRTCYCRSQTSRGTTAAGRRRVDRIGR